MLVATTIAFSGQTHLEPVPFIESTFRAYSCFKRPIAGTRPRVNSATRCDQSEAFETTLF